MFTELIDTLRCPNRHEDSWLVASSSRSDERHIIDGTLGCPICRASFAIVGGEARFAAPPAQEPVATLDDDAAFRLAAQLHLVEAPEPVLLIGVWTAAAIPLLRLTPTVKLFLGNSRLARVVPGQTSTITHSTARLPLAGASLRAVAIDATHATDALVGDCTRVLRVTGRLVAPAGVMLDAALWKPLARDDEVQVAERLPAPSGLVQLKRAPAKPLFGS